MRDRADRRPRPVLCVIAHEHRDRDRAEAVAAGRFTHAGETRELGTEPDWLGADLPADEEWRIEWVKFAYGLDLAHAYAITGDQRFQAAWERLVGSWLRAVPPDPDAAEVAARRILNWIYAWQALRRARAPASPHRLLESIAAQAAHVREHLTPERNHRTLELYALLITALALPPLDDGLLAFAIAELDANLAQDFRADGVHREGSTHYHCIALRSFVGARENAVPLRHRAARRVRRPPRRGLRLRGPLPPARRHDPDALGRRQRRLLRAARAGRRPRTPKRRSPPTSPTAATTRSAAAGDPTTRS